MGRVSWPFVHRQAEAAHGGPPLVDVFGGLDAVAQPVEVVQDDAGSAGDGGGMTDSTSSMAEDSCSAPVGSPLASRSM